MLVVDTNVLASLLLDGPFSEAAHALYGADPDWRSEGFVLVEFCNVLTTQIRLRELPVADAQGLLSQGTALFGQGLMVVDHAAALALAAQHGVSAYDARFLAVARSLKTRLVTEDARLRRAAAELTWSIDDALADARARSAGP